MNWAGAFDGRVAIVTAASVGIGQAIGRVLAGGGAKVTLADLDEAGVNSLADELRTQGADVLPLRFDGMVAADVDKVVQQTVEHFGHLDTLVNAVGGYHERPARTVLETTEAAWSAGLALQVTPAFLCSKAAAPQLMTRGRSRIVNIGSIVARGQFYYTSPPYVAGKAALHALTRYLAQELGPHGVTVNVVAPGPVYSPRTRPGLEAGGAERVISGSALGRVGDPEDVAETVAFLVSDAARHITGATLDINGGYLMV